MIKNQKINIVVQYQIQTQIQIIRKKSTKQKTIRRKVIIPALIEMIIINLIKKNIIIRIFILNIKVKNQKKILQMIPLKNLRIKKKLEQIIFLQMYLVVVPHLIKSKIKEKENIGENQV